MTGSASGGGGAVVVTCSGSLTRSGKEEGGRVVTGAGGGDIGTSAGRGSTTGGEAGGALVGGRGGPEGSLMRSMTFSESLMPFTIVMFSFSSDSKDTRRVLLLAPIPGQTSPLLFSQLVYVNLISS